MTGKEIIERLNGQGISLSIQDKSIKVAGCVTNEHRNLVKTYKQAVIEELIKQSSEDSPNQQPIETLIADGYELELAQLIVWAFENDHKWPITPFTLSDDRLINDPKHFYLNELCPAITQDQGKTTNKELKAILLRLQQLVDSNLVAA